MFLNSRFDVHLCYLYICSIIILCICCGVMISDCQPHSLFCLLLALAQTQPPAQPTELGA